MTGPSDRFEAHVSVWRTLLLVALSLAFVAVGAFLMLHAGDVAMSSRRAAGQPWPVRAIGAAGCVLFGAFAMIGLASLRQRGAVLSIDADGVLWRRWSDTRIPWDAVEAMGATRVQRQRFLSLWLRDPAAYPSTSRLARLARANRAMGHGDLAISVAAMDRSLDDLLAAVERFAPTPLQSLPNTAS